MTSPLNSRFEHAGALLTVDLTAICDNWRMLRSRVGAASCAAVVKADAYGLGAHRVAPALAGAGCRHFFVAHLDEAIRLRDCLRADASVYVLHGAPVGAEREFLAHRLVPVLNSLAQLDAWSALARARNASLPALLQVDTGMARLGLSSDELQQLAGDIDRLQGVALSHLMSHLGAAEQADNPQNREQLARFQTALAAFPACGGCFANSSGIFLGSDYHFNLVRPGAALYGVAPVEGAPNPMRPVVRLQGKIIQTRQIEAGSGVGYGPSWRAGRATRIATVAAGYADGLPRSLSNRMRARLGEYEVAQVGNVSMDTLTFDVSDVPETLLQPGALLDLLDAEQGVDALAAQAGTIGYEILTSLGRRYARHYLGG